MSRVTVSPVTTMSPGAQLTALEGRRMEGWMDDH